MPPASWARSSSRSCAGDNAGDSAQAASLATKAGADSKVIGAFCCWSSGLALATHSLYNRYGVPTILGGSNDHRSTRPFHKSAVIFRNSPYDLINMKMLATYATNYAKLKRIFTIDDNTAFSVTQVNEFTKAAVKLHGKGRIIGRESVQLGREGLHAPDHQAEGHETGQPSSMSATWWRRRCSASRC